METAAPMVMERALVAVCGVGEVESVAWAVKLKVPAAEGVPLMVQLGARVSPVGRVPAVTVQE